MAALRIGRFVFFAILFVLLAFASASAYEVYNHTNKTLRVRGEGCAGCFDVEIKPKHHKACPADSHGCGSRYISILASDFVGEITECANDNYIPLRWYLYVGKKVPPHGWVSIYNHNRGDYHWLSGTVKNKHGDKIWSGLLKVKCGTR